MVGHQTPPQSSIMTGWRVTGVYHNATNGTTSPARISPSALLVNRGLGWVTSLLSSNLVLLGGGLWERINSTKKGEIALALFVDIYVLFEKTSRNFEI